jgi:MerR family transcriptional regulator, copper efflux regulator
MCFWFSPWSWVSPAGRSPLPASAHNPQQPATNTDRNAGALQRSAAALQRPEGHSGDRRVSSSSWWEVVSLAGGRKWEPMRGQVSFSIGDAAEASGLAVKTIRYYEEIGLIPKARRTNTGVHTGGHRLHGEVDVGRLRFIHHARLFGLGLADIRELLALADGKGCPSGQPEYHNILKRHLHEIDERVRYHLGLRSAIEDLIAPARRSEGQKCSWGTCTCMGKPASAKASRDTGLLDNKGGHHV